MATSGQGVVRHQLDRARAQLEHQQREHQPADHAAAEDGQHEGATRISKTPAAKTKAFQGVGGGSMEGIIMARNSWRSKRARIRS